MASQKEKLIAEALKLVEKGQYERAVKVYLKVVAEDDKDVRIWLKVGDLYTKLRRNAEAAETYQHVAQAYSEQGFYTKAIAVYKQILKLDPSLVNVHERLADLYRQMGLIPDAIDQYSQVAAYHGKEGNAKAALASLKQIVELDPQNVATRVKLAELYSREQMVREAIDEFAKAAEHLHEQGRHDDYMKVAERLLFHSPDNRPVSRELARLYLERNDARKALPRLQVCFKADPRDGETLSLLAEAFRALGQTVKAVSVLKELARIQLEIGAALEREDTFRRILELDPHDAEARAALPHAPEEAAPAAYAPPSRPAAAVTLGGAAPPRRATERPTIVNPAGAGPGAPATTTPPPAPRRAVERPTIPAPRVIPVAPPAPVAPPTSPSLPPSMTSSASLPPTPASALRPPSSPSLSPAAPSPPPGAPAGPASPAQSGRYSRLAPTVEVTGAAADALSRPAPRPAVSRSDLSPSAVLLPMGSMAPLPPTASSPVSIAPSFSRAPAPPSPPSSDNLEPPPVTEEELRKILAETDVFAKYNLHAKAIEHIRTVFDRDPTHVAAREKLKGLLMAVGRKADALEELRTLAHQAEGLASESGYLDEMLEIDPSDVWARRRREVLLVSPPPAPSLAEARGGGGLPEHVDVDLSDVETSGGPGAPAAPRPSSRPAMATRGAETPRPTATPPSSPARRPLEVQAAGDDFAVVVDEGPASRPPPAPEPLEDRFGEDLDAAGLPSLAAAAPGGGFEGLDLATPPPPSLPTAILANGLDSVRPIGGHQPPTPNRAITTTGRADLGRLRGARRELVTAPAVVVPPVAPPGPRPSSSPALSPSQPSSLSLSLGPPSQTTLTTPDAAPLAGAPDLELVDEATPVTPPPLADLQATAEPASLTDELRDIDFYLSQGIVHEARAALEALAASHPGHPALLARLATLPAASTSPAPASAPAATPAPSPTPTLAGSPAPFAPTPPPARPATPAPVALAAAGGSELQPEGEVTQSVRMEALLEGEREAARLGSRGLTEEDISAVSVMPTRRNVVEVGVSADDFAMHFELGIGYKGMGLLDDAIVEFKLAAKDPAREVQCHQMIGLCYLDKGRAHDAVRHFKQGLYAERILEDEELSLYYELGLVYERIGDRTESLYYFERIRKRKPRYRDVERRIESLLPPATPASAATPPPAAIQRK